MNKRALPADEIARVIQYAYNHDYEIDECLNLLNSKGQHKENLHTIRKAYKEYE